MSCYSTKVFCVLLLLPYSRPMSMSYLYPLRTLHASLANSLGSLTLGSWWRSFYLTGKSGARSIPTSILNSGFCLVLVLYVLCCVFATLAVLRALLWFYIEDLLYIHVTSCWPCIPPPWYCCSDLRTCSSALMSFTLHSQAPPCSHIFQCKPVVLQSLLECSSVLWVLIGNQEQRNFLEAIVAGIWVIFPCISRYLIESEPWVAINPITGLIHSLHPEFTFSP